MMTEEKRNTRLYKLFKNEEAVNNILGVYKDLRGKENAKYRLLLKALVYSTINCESPNAYIPKEDYFGKPPFDKKYLFGVWERWRGRFNTYRAFGFKIKNIYGKLV